MNPTSVNDQSNIQYDLDPQVRVAPEIRVQGDKRVHNVGEARDYIRALRTTVTVSSTEHVAITEANPPVTHIAPLPIEKSVAAEASVPQEVASTDLDEDAIRAQVAVLADTSNAQDARNEYGIAA